MVQAVSAPAITTTAPLAGSGAVVIVDDDIGVADELARALEARGEPVLRVPREQQPRDAEQAGLLAEAIRDRGGAKALVHLAALRDATAPAASSRRSCCSPRRCSPTCRRRPAVGAPRSSGRAASGAPSASTGARPPACRRKGRWQAS